MLAIPEVETSNQRIVLVTGPSGAGRSTAINALEDIGYESIDNLPISMLPRLLNGPALQAPLALGVDTRNREFSTQVLLDSIEELARSFPLDFEVLYVDCTEEVLMRRFSETRRRHPMAPDADPRTGIAREFAVLGPIRDRADILIDSSHRTPHQMRAEIEALFAIDKSQKMAVSVHSFSYKRGLPRSVDMILDCRFLHNPHWVEELRSKTGREAEVAAYIRKDARYDAFLQQVTDLCKSLLPAYTEEGKAHFSIGFGCTGGKHRSVAVAEAVTEALALTGWQVSTRHRELERGLLGS